MHALHHDLLALFASISTLALAACGGSSPPTASDPHTTSGTGATVAPAGTGGISQPGDPTGTFPSQGAGTLSAAPASPMEGGCAKGATSNTASTDLATCLDGCKGQDETVPLGSKCISAKASCTAQCNAKFKK